MKPIRVSAFFILFLSLFSIAVAKPVNINMAGADSIAESLTGVGPSKANAIVAYRTKHGPFKSVDQLTEVKGIGEGLLKKIRSDILLNSK